MTMRIGSEPVPGQELTASIRLVKKLGEGGMGSVWTAQHLGLHTQVAVKFLAVHMTQDAAAAARFQREAMAAARIKSPHVVQMFDHGMSPEFGPYIVMELLEGETLSAFVQRHGRLTPQYTAKIVAQLCRALSKAHAQGIIHRDIKPDNVFLIDPEQEAFVKVLDFGIAKNLRDEMNVTSTGTMMGTPHYMSPEQMLSSKHVDLRADLWATAVLAYHALTGEVPFDGETFGAVAIAVTQAEFAPAFSKYGAGSPELDGWFKRALARDINARFGSAEELAETFARAAGVVAPSTSGGSAGTGQHLAQAATVDPARPAPTFTGVANTMPGARPAKVYAVLVGAVLALGALLAVALLLLKTREPEAPITASAQPSLPSASAVHAAPSAVPVPSPSVHAVVPSTSAPPIVASAPKPLHLRSRAEPPKPSATPTTGPARPDRGF